jgi:hypothetical protein
MSDYIARAEGLATDGDSWLCLTCGHSISSAGTDESSRNALRAFQVRHRHKEKE